MAATCCKTLDPNVLNTIPCVFSNFTVLIHPHMQPNDQYLIIIIPKLLHSLFLCVSVCVVCSTELLSLWYHHVCVLSNCHSLNLGDCSEEGLVYKHLSRMLGNSKALKTYAIHKCN